MKLSPILSRYMARTYMLNLTGMILCLLAVIYLFDTVELLRRASKKDDVPLSAVLEMGLFKLFDVGLLTFPFAVLFSALFTFWQMTRRYELVIVRAAGFSVWQFLTPVMGVAIVTGILSATLLNPVGAVLLGKFKAMESSLLTHRSSHVALFDEGLWLRQSQFEDGYIVLHADRVKMPEWQLQGVMALYFAADDTLQKRVDSETATLDDGKGMWLFSNAAINAPHEKPASVPLVALPTDLTAREIESSFSSPGTMSFWKLPAFIKIMESTGFDATRLRVHFHSLLALPLLFTAMILLAAAVALRPPRSRGAFNLIAAGVVIGFVTFFLSSFLQALGASHQIPVLLAAWSPAVILLLLGMAVILNLEDG